MTVTRLSRSALARRARSRSDDEEREAATGTPDAGPVANRLLGLQRDAGNSAVATLVGSGAAASVAPAVAQRQSAHVLTADEEKELPKSADAPGLVSEAKELDAKKAAIEKAAAEAAKRGETVAEADKTLSAADATRRVEITRLLKLRVKGDIGATLEANGVKTGTAAWYAEVKPTTFLGQSVTVHKLLAERLKKAEALLANEKPPDGGWFASTSSLREPGQSLHSFGLAIDLDGGKNPYLLNPDAPNAKFVEATARSRAIKDIIDRAMLLVEAKTPAEADLQSRPKLDDPDARVEASYRKLETASQALACYMGLDDPGERASLERYVSALGSKDRRTADQWAAQIKADRKVLKAHAGPKSWRDPEKGFLSLDFRLVRALTTASGGGLTWLGDDTIGSGRDIMHFDMRGVGPIRKIVKSAEGQVIGLGSG